MNLQREPSQDFGPLYRERLCVWMIGRRWRILYNLVLERPKSTVRRDFENNDWMDHLSKANNT